MMLCDSTLKSLTPSVNASFRIHTIRDKLSIMPASTTIKQRYCEERWGLGERKWGCKGAFGQLKKNLTSWRPRIGQGKLAYLEP
jgi:hypothetical protein